MVLSFICSLISGIVEKYRDRFFSIFFSYFSKEYFHWFDIAVCFGDDWSHIVRERIECSKDIEPSSSGISGNLFCSFLPFLLPSVIIFVVVDLMHRIQEQYNRVILFRLFDMEEYLLYGFLLNFFSLMLSWDEFGFLVRQIQFFLQYSESQLTWTCIW